MTFDLKLSSTAGSRPFVYSMSLILNASRLSTINYSLKPLSFNTEKPHPLLTPIRRSLSPPLSGPRPHPPPLHRSGLGPAPVWQTAPEQNPAPTFLSSPGRQLVSSPPFRGERCYSARRGPRISSLPKKIRTSVVFGVYRYRLKPARSATTGFTPGIAYSELSETDPHPPPRFLRASARLLPCGGCSVRPSPLISLWFIASSLDYP